MSKEVINIKSNGIRNELKEIRKSIDALTAVIVDIVGTIDIATAQTHTQNESKICNCGNCSCNDDKLLDTTTDDN